MKSSKKLLNLISRLSGSKPRASVGEIVASLCDAQPPETVSDTLMIERAEKWLELLAELRQKAVSNQKPPSPPPRLIGDGARNKVYWVEPRIVWGRFHDPGSDYETDRLILIDAHTTVIWWWRGGTTWKSLGCSEYRPAVLDIASRNGVHWIPNTIHEGGRLSRALLKRYKETIESAIGLPLTDSAIDAICDRKEPRTILCGSYYGEERKR